MKAICYTQYGSSDVLKSVELQVPEPGANEALVRVEAASVNPADWRLRKGSFRRGMPLKFPFIPGNDLSGTVVQIGNSVSDVTVGDLVFAMTPLREGGAFAEYCLLDEKLLVPAPVKISLSEAAAIPLAALTALQGLRDYGKLQENQKVLIVGGAGGVGHFAIQVAKNLGAEITTVSSQSGFKLCRNLGAQETLDYNDPSIYEGSKKYDVIFDAVAIERFDRWRKLIKLDGRVVTVNPIIGKILPEFVTRMMGVNRLCSFFVKPNHEDLLYLRDLVDSQLLRPIVEKTFSLGEIAQAHNLSEAGHVHGKLIIQMRTD